MIQFSCGLPTTSFAFPRSVRCAPVFSARACVLASHFAAHCRLATPSWTSHAECISVLRSSKLPEQKLGRLGLAFPLVRPSVSHPITAASMHERFCHTRNTAIPNAKTTFKVLFSIGRAIGARTLSATFKPPFADSTLNWTSRTTTVTRSISSLTQRHSMIGFYRRSTYPRTPNHRLKPTPEIAVRFTKPPWRAQLSRGR